MPAAAAAAVADTADVTSHTINAPHHKTAPHRNLHQQHCAIISRALAGSLTLRANRPYAFFFSSAGRNRRKVREFVFLDRRW